MISSGLPLCEPALEGEVSFSPVPTYLGTLGSCDAASNNTSSTEILKFTCNQTHTQDSFNRNCSTLFTAASAEAAEGACRSSEDDGGQGCCDSSSVFENAYGSVIGFEVVPLGTAKGLGTSYTCP